MTYIEEYYKWIQEHPNRVGKKVKIIYEKLVDDLKKQKTVSFFNSATGETETHTYIFDEKKSLRCIHFCERYCKQSKGKWNGKPLKLELFQKAFLQALFGFVDKDTGFRKYRKAIFFVARKNGKSVLASAIATYMLTADYEGGAEIYSVATKRDQSKIVWEEAKRMIKKSPALSKVIRCLVGGIYYDKTDGVFRALASDSNSLDGLNAHLVVADETHAWKDKNLLDVMYDSMSAREQPLLLETSTMGTIRQNVFDIEYDYASQVIDGTVPDEVLLPVIYELDDEKEWINEECWFKANPALGVIKSMKDLRDKVERAKANPIELVNLLCKDFNIRQNSINAWLTFEDLNNEEIYSEWKGSYCIGGCDLSSTTDLTCATLLIPKNEKLYVIQMYWLPVVEYEKRKAKKIPFEKWHDLGLLRLCNGSTINPSDVVAWFVEMYQNFNIIPLWTYYDSYSSRYFVDEMEAHSFKMVRCIQGAKTLSNPMRILGAELAAKKINYNNNPLLKWCLANVNAVEDRNANILPVKRSNPEMRIDGFASLLDAFVGYEEHKSEMKGLS